MTSKANGNLRHDSIRKDKIGYTLVKREMSCEKYLVNALNSFTLFWNFRRRVRALLKVYFLNKPLLKFWCVEFPDSNTK